MANKKNVETKKKNTEIKIKKSSELEQKKRTQKKKLRLHSHLKVNIPLFQSLMMILPSLAKHAVAEDVDSSGDTADQVAANSMTAKDSSNDHGNTDSSAVTNQEAQPSDSDVNSTLSASHAPHSSISHLVPSHHLSTLSHSQVHYIPSVSMPTISSGSNGQPTHSNAPTMPALPVSFMPEVIKGTYGELHVDANGQYTFVLNPKSPQYILLNQYQQGTDHFLLHLSNGSSVIVQVPVTGKQDAPNISGDLAGVVTEDHNIDSQGLLHANGKIDVIDPDQNESSMKPEVLAGKYGSLSIDADGHWQYHVDNSLSNIQALTSATSLHESFVIHTQDGTPQTLDMTIGGNDDNAVVTGIDTGVVTEDVTTQIQGQLTVNDSDLGENHFQASQINGHLGTLTITKDGAWTYALDNSNPAVQRLAQGSTATDIITVHSADGTAHQVTVTITGTGDAATIGGVDTGSIIENTAGVNMSPDYAQPGIATLGNTTLYADGKLTITDPDVGESGFERQGSNGYDYHGTYGDLILLTDGTWHYHADAGHLSGIGARPTTRGTAIDQLGEGQSLTDTITVHSKDGTTHDIVITIHGSNDRPYCSSEVVLQSGCEDTRQTLTTAQLLANTVDVDANDAGKLTIENLHVDHGSILNNADGTFTFTPEKDYNGDVHFRYDVKDAHGGVTHTGASTTLSAVDDAAVITGTGGHLLEEDNLYYGYTIKTSGQFQVVDPDGPGQSKFPDGLHHHTGTLGGTLQLYGNGNYFYHIDNSTVNHLAKGQEAKETFTIHSVDGTSHQVEFVIEGTNDAPFVHGDVTLSPGTEDTAVTLYASDLLAQAGDYDDGETAQLSVHNLSADHGTIIDNKDGTYTFKPDADYNGTVHFTYDVQDPQGATVATSASMALAAVADTPVLNVDITDTSDNTLNDSESGAAAISGTLDPSVASTLDRIEITDGTTTVTVDKANITVATDGTYQTTANISSLKDGTLTVTAHATSHDGTTATSTDTIIKDSVASVHDNNASMNENQPSIHGNLIADDEAGVQVTGGLGEQLGSYGKFVIHANGTYTYTPDARAQALNLNEHQQETFTFTVTDKAGNTAIETFQISLSGRNDGPVITNAVSDSQGATVEDGATRVSGQLSASDLDTGDQLSWEVVGSGSNPGTGNYGNLAVVPSTGQWVYRLDQGAHTQALADGEQKQETFTLRVTDSYGASVDQTVVITVTGTNDAPVVSSSVTLAAGIEDTTVTLTEAQLLANASDVDHGEAALLSVHNLNADHGTVTDNKDGTFTFTPEPNYNGAVSFTYDVQDPQGATVATSASMALAAVADAAVISGVDTGTATEDSVSHGSNNLIVSGQLRVADVDSGEGMFTVTGQSNHQAGLHERGTPVAGDHGLGQFVVHANGTWTFIADNTSLKIQALAEHQTIQETFTVHSKDGTAHTITVDIVGTNDAPTVSSSVTLAAGTEDTAVTLTEAQLLANASDVDNGETAQLSVHNLSADHGTITDNKDGTFTFTPEPNYNGAVSFTYDVQDPQGATVATSASMALAAVADAAQISGTDSASLTEDSHVYSAGKSHIIETGQNHLNISDSDVGEAIFTPTGSVHGTGTAATGSWVAGDKGVGEFILHADGRWLYHVDNQNTAIQGLKEGETFTETITVHSKDGTDVTLTATVNGTDDKPVVSGAVDLGSTAEDTTKHFSAADLLANTTDADGDALSIVDGSVTAEHGTLSGDAVHGFVFTPDANYHGTDIAITFTATDGHSTVAGTATLDVTATNDATKVVATSASTTEDTDIVLTKSQLLAGATDVDGDTLDINSVTVNGGHGTVTDNHDGTWTLHPEENYKGDITLGYKVNDGTADVDNHMTVAVTSVTDAADINLSVAPQKGFQTDSAHHLSIDAILNPDGGGDHTARDYGNSLTFEMGITLDKSETYHNGDVIAQYGGHISSPGKLDYAQMHYYSDGSRLGNGGVTLTNPHSVTVWISGMDPIETHIDITDGKLHRLTVVVDEGQGIKAPTMSIFDNGKPVDYPDGSNSESMPTHYLGDSGSSEHYLTAPKAGMTLTESGFLEASAISIPYGGGHANVPTSLAERAGSTELVIGTGRSPISLGDGRYATGYDHGHIVWSHGSNHDGGNVPPITPIVATIEHVTVVKEAVAASQVAQGPLGEQGLDPKHVLIDLGVNGAGIVDHTGLHSTVVPSGSDHSHVINTAGINVTNDPHHLVINADVTPHDKDDALQAVHLHGLPIGSVVTDGTHTHTIDATDQKDGLDILGWARGSLEVKVPSSVSYNAIITVEATTQNPDGTSAHSASSAPVILDPAHAGDVIVSAPPISGVEDKGPYDLTLTAIDPTDAHAAVTFAVSGLPAGATLSAGSYDANTKTWTITPSEANGLQITLPKDFSGSVTPHITATSSAGHSHSIDMSGSITDTQDVAVISGTDSASITEDIHVQSSGIIETNQNQLNVRDPDAGEALFTPTGTPSGSGSTATGSWVAGDKGIGQFILHADGRWLYKVDNDNTHINSLGDGDTFTETLTVHSKDGTTHQLTSTIHGTNDKPVIDATSAVTAIEGGHTAHKGQITTTDVDTGDSATYTAITPTTGQHVPGFTLNADGSYEFDATDAGYDHLALGKTEQVSVSVTVTDGAGATDQKDLIITITGTNDRPTVVSSLAQHIHSIDEDTTQHFSAKDFGFIDKDHGDQLDHITITALPDAFKGQFEYDGHPITIPLDVLTADISKLTFVPAQDYNGGVQFGFTVNDGHTDSFPKIGNFEIIPVDDISTVSGTDTLSMTEGSAANTHADLTVAKGAWLANVDGHFDFPEVVANDPNAGRWYAIVGAGVAGGAAHGMKIETTQWVMNMGDPNYGHNGYMTFTRNTDHATASYNAVDRVEADLFINDPDTLPATFIDVTDSLGDNGYGKFSMHNGHWSFVGGDKTTALADGEKATETFTFNTSDGVTHQVTVNLTGSDTKAEFKGDISANLKEGDIGDTVSAHGTLNIVDVDTGQNPIIADFHDKSGVNGYGHFSMVNNQWTYEIDQTKVQKLNASESVQDKITVTASDGTTQDIVISIRGTNDAPEVTGAVANTDDSEGHAIDMTLPSNLFTDVEGDSFTLSLAVSQHTEEAVNPDSVNPGWQGKDTALGMPTWLHFDEKTGRIWGTPPHSADGDLDITVTATDANGAKGTYDFHIAVTDVDAKGIAHANVNEDDRATGQHSANGQLDAYHNGQHIIWHEQATGQDSTPNMIQGKYGHLQISTGGTWIYFLDHDGDQHWANKDLNALKAGQVEQEHFTIHGLQNGKEVATEQVIIAVTGKNDGATINGTMTSKSVSTITEDAAKDTLAGHLNLVDADHGEDQFIPDPHIAGTYGHLELAANGDWVYHLDNSLATTNSLSAAQGGTETFTINSPDNTASHTITINVNGVDDPLTSPAPPPPVQHDEPDFSAETSEDISVTLDDVGLVVPDSQHQAVNAHPVTGAAAYLDALGISPPPPSANDAIEHQLPADIDIVMAEADHAALGHDDVSHIDLSDALEHQGHEHDTNQQDHDDTQHHNQVDDLPDIDPNS
ncbi:VCBS domain-containing protein [Vibrio anguillarum]|nr:VCBS domain-containing protein [Vibrio anguillarum]ATC56832.1 hypothetical protein CMV05_03630 [Vibrio anguillarum]MBF4252374.1 tandem-95 repeat protein [Vibrio anguillarum]MBF4389603.1 tandem-95 repeat protein [Vibrio anguillarum]MBF4402227.1 tandem-95 repeat protein [Vibrio anguillarum]